MTRKGLGLRLVSTVLVLTAAPAPAPATGVEAPATGVEAGPAIASLDTVRADTVPPDTVPRYRTDDIAVTVTRAERITARVPYAVALLDAGAFQEGERGASLADALWRIPGMFAQDRRNFALGDRITVRGAGARAQFGVRGIRVLLDGIPLTLPDGQTTLENLDMASLGRLEVIRGPAAALYGNAAAGVLSFRTLPPADRPLRVEPRAVVGSDGWQEARLQASGRSGRLEYVAAGSRLVTDGFREHADAEILRGTAVVARPLDGGGEVRGLVNLYRAPFSRNPGSLSLEDALERPRMAREAQVAQGTGKETNQAQAGLSLERPLGEGAGFRATTWGVRREVWNPIPGNIIDLSRWSGGVRGEIWGETRAGALPFRWAVGLDVEGQWDDRVERENQGVPEGGDRTTEGERLLDQEERVLSLGPFVQLELDLDRAWTITVASRMDLFRFQADDRLQIPRDHSGKRSFQRLSPMAGITWTASPGLHLFGNVTTAFQTPTTSELSNRPDGSGGFHPELDPEHTVGFEAGARGALADPRLGWTVSAFRATVADALIPFEGPTGEIFFRNAGEVVRRGVEASATWLPAPSLRADLAYTLHHARFTAFETAAGDFAGNQEPGVPDHAVAVSLLHRAPFGLISEARFRWVDAYPVNDANNAHNLSHRVVDLRFSLNREMGRVGFRPFLGIDNLFDERYNGSVIPNAFGGRYYEPAPGIQLYGGFGLALPGAPRRDGP